MKRQIIPIIILILTYLLLANSRSVEQNPFISGAVIAVYMIVPVIAGVLYGKFSGLTVGLLATGINSLTPAGSIYEILSIAPHAIMGFSAGLLKEKISQTAGIFCIILGHLLNIIMYTIFGLFEIATITQFEFWLGIGYEVLIGIISIIIITTLYRFVFTHHETTHN